MKPKASTLFHFTKNINFLKLILKEGFWPRYCLEDLQWTEGLDFMAYPMTCFCDIPLARITEHVSFYGEFGIGMKKKWALENNINPLLYISPNSHTKHTILKISSLLDASPNQEQEKAETFMHLMAHIKPVYGSMSSIDGGLIEKEFYQESEWRYVPKMDGPGFVLSKEQYNNEKNREEYNSITKAKSSLKATPNDINYIFVKSDNDICSMIDYIQTELGEYSHSQIKILLSRVTSLESIMQDV